jgi:hypothetical protein
VTYGCPYALQAIAALNTLMHFAMRYPRQNSVVFKVEDAPQLRIVSTELAEAVDTLIEAIDKAIQRFTRAIAKGGDLDSLVEALKDQETRKQEILAILFSLEAPTAKPAEIRQQLEGYLTNWRGLLRSNVTQGQQALRRLIDGRLTFTPRGDYYEFRGIGTVEPVLGGLVQKLASPRGLVDLYQIKIRGETRRASNAPSSFSVEELERLTSGDSSRNSLRSAHVPQLTAHCCTASSRHCPCDAVWILARASPMLKLAAFDLGGNSSKDLRN